MVFDYEKAMEDRAKMKQEKREEETYGIYFALENGEYFLDTEKGISPEQAFSVAFQRARRLGKKIDLENCRVKNQGKIFNHQGKEIE